MSIQLNGDTRIIAPDLPESVSYAIDDVTRDLGKAFTADAHGDHGDIRLRFADLADEQYAVRVDGNDLLLEAGDDLGFIYGLYAISRSVLGVTDLWFWNDQHIEPADGIDLDDDFRLESTRDAVRYKGFFINDEVLLEDWSVDNDPELPWRRAFETILRLGGNTAIPGSGQRGEPHLPLARRMGLYINQHHATPLGARLFSEAYPGVSPKWPEDRERFESLWREGIEANLGGRTIWTLGFRGQGDSPFWSADPRYTTDEARGKVMSEVIQRQYDMVRELDPNAPCSVYLYGESMDLYRKGVLRFPDDVIKIWSDNGFGRMVSRRQHNDNPRIDAMPNAADAGRNGIYYHASFYDLQAANHITQLCVNPRNVAAELEQVLANGGSDLWIINSSNIKPHAFMLDLIARLWREGHANVDAVEYEYAARYFGGAIITEGRKEPEETYRGDADAPNMNVMRAVVDCLEGYWQAAVPYGPNWDDKAGEQFFNHVPRMLAVQFMRDRASADPELKWMCDNGGIVARSLADQVAYYRSLCEPGAARYRELARRDEIAVLQVEGENPRAARLMRDSLLLQARLYRHCVQGALMLCRSLQDAFDGHWRHAFYHAGLAREEYLAADHAMRSREHGKWRGFWRNDCLTDVKQTALVLESLMGYLRAIGDGPHYYQWKRDFLYPAWEKDVMVIMNMENHETDQEIFAAMKATWQD
ncbi:glycosyl hydrolase 115 family protein [Bifidobacterium callimiconis]|uniref:Glycosyl hydrolase n=1 Tax=Bifidobacterium callimiconis TaxID=2306973 RepID=A0A430FG70_9BIFI|nr:glycosyl hydrolase 115 family protein [Bifidobacterium callimiconis]RSX51895.1 Glycosyl hydrolase [Bifidobacterium callimiconis]